LENNVGFFAKSKGAEAMIASVQEKIARAKQEMADAIERVKLIDSQE
jgi:glycerol-3-phosphate responsive antiterminator